MDAQVSDLPATTSQAYAMHLHRAERHALDGRQDLSLKEERTLYDVQEFGTQVVASTERRPDNDRTLQAATILLEDLDKIQEMVVRASLEEATAPDGGVYHLLEPVHMVLIASRRRTPETDRFTMQLKGNDLRLYQFRDILCHMLVHLTAMAHEYVQKSEPQDMDTA